MKMETTFLVTQKPTAKKGATTVVDVQQTNRTMGAIKERMKTTDTSKATDWEKKLYANGNVFSKEFVDSSKLFTLWNEGVEKSEIMFANYQQSLLYVLQHLCKKNLTESPRGKRKPFKNYVVINFLIF